MALPRICITLLDELLHLAVRYPVQPVISRNPVLVENSLVRSNLARLAGSLYALAVGLSVRSPFPRDKMSSSVLIYAVFNL
jgi:hypothetical protein